MHTATMRTALGALLIAVLATGAAPASAETVNYTTALSGASEVPPTDVKDAGKVDAQYDPATKKLTWTVTYSSLSGPVTAAHFHGPAKAGANAGPVVTLKTPLDSPIKGEATLTDAQAKELEEGLIYLNLHTAKHPGGEVRGQLQKQ